MSEHTPGPWIVEKIDSLTPWTDALSIGAEDEYGCHTHVAHTTRGFEGAYLENGEHDETSCAWANARLIAAAPDLLEAMDEIYAMTRLGNGRLPKHGRSIIANIAQRAIKKATAP